MKTLVFDMYGVILNESKGNFRAFLESRKMNADYAVYKSVYPGASLGEISLGDFFGAFGFDDPETSAMDYAMDYVDNFLTADSGFFDFAEKYREQYHFVMLSNDIHEFNQLICKKYGLDRYFSAVITSGDAHIRKPDIAIFYYALEKFGLNSADCVFIDDNYNNVVSAREVGMDAVMFSREGYSWNGKNASSYAELDLLLKDDIVLLEPQSFELAASVIRASFKTVADEFNLTRENIPTHGTFMSAERMVNEYNAGTLAFGYFSDGKMIGTVELSDHGEGLWFLNKLAVLPNFRHTGIGAALLDFADNYVKDHGGNKISVSIIEESLRLKKWYISHGYIHMGTKIFDHIPFTVGYLIKEVIKS